MLATNASESLGEQDHRDPILYWWLDSDENAGGDWMPKNGCNGPHARGGEKDIPPPLAKVQGGRGGLKYNTGFVFFYLWISPSIHIHIYMYIYICTFFLK